MRVYFNRCFTQTAEVIKQLKTNEGGEMFEIYLSSYGPNYYLESVSDYFEVEPKDYTIEEYVEYCYQFCLKHQIDVFVPRNLVSELVKACDRFESIGVKVLWIGDASLYQLLDNKVATYDALASKELVGIPPYGLVRTYQEFEGLYQDIRSSGFEVCLKPAEGIGGVGFKRIMEDWTMYDQFKSDSSTRISLAFLKEVLRNQVDFEPFMLLGYLDGVEFSIDCLAKEGQLIEAIPRCKVDRYTQRIESRAELLKIAKDLTQVFGLNHLYNIQVKYHQGTVYLIEFNTRMSGGTYKSCLSGINLLYKAICQLTGQDITSELGKVPTGYIRTIQACEVELDD